jgi:hypothetical protein
VLTFLVSDVMQLASGELVAISWRAHAVVPVTMPRGVTDPRSVVVDSVSDIDKGVDADGCVWLRGRTPRGNLTQSTVVTLPSAEALPCSPTPVRLLCRSRLSLASLTTRLASDVRFASVSERMALAEDGTVYMTQPVLSLASPLPLVQVAVCPADVRAHCNAYRHSSRSAEVERGDGGRHGF